jgi:DNA processing protein
MTEKTTFEMLHQQHHGLTRDALARAVWSIISEPGDVASGQLIATRTAAGALEIILDGTETVEGIDLGGIRERVAPHLNPGVVEVALRQAVRFGVELVTPEHPHWPTRINDLEYAAPHALWVRGNTELLADELSTAIVGARAATGYGEHVTMEMSAGLVDRGHTIVSGAAYGIDGMAHRAALASHGRTVAYLAGGVERFYPAGHDALLARIVECGAVVSELPCGAAPTKWRFLMRNRLIAAASRATLVVEAGWRSGSLNTATHAHSIGRPLGAVPGPVTSAASAGCHRLIREYGATIVTNAAEAAEL